MNKPAAVGSVVVLSLAAFVAGRYSGAPKSTSHSSSKRILYYVDPMHPAYRSDKPGIAPDCGMPLEPVYEGDEPAGKLQLAARSEERRVGKGCTTGRPDGRCEHEG